MYSFSNLEPVHCSMSSLNCCFLTCKHISQEAGKVVWYSHLLKNFPQFFHKNFPQFSTVKGFTAVNKEVQFSSVAQSCPTLCDPMNHSTPGLPVHHQLPEFTQTHAHWVSDAIQPSHPLSSPSPPAPRGRCSSGILLLFRWTNGCWHLISGSSAFSKSTLIIWKFTVHILLRPGLEKFEHYFASVWDEYNCAIVWTFFGMGLEWKLTFSSPVATAEFSQLAGILHEMFAWNVPLVSPIFLKRSLVFPILLFSLVCLHWSLRKAFLSLLNILWSSAFRYVYLSFSPLPFFPLLFSAICKSSSDNHFAFLNSFFLGMVLVTASCTVLWTSVLSSSGTLSIGSNPLNLFVTSTV